MQEPTQKMSSYKSVEERNTVLLYAHPSMHGLAEAICTECTDERDSIRAARHGGQQLQKLASQKEFFYSPRRVAYRQDIEWSKFDDGFPKLFIKDVKDMAGRDVICLCSFHSQECIFDQLSIMLAIPRYLARSVTYILPYFPTGTMERIDREGQIATAKTLSALLSAIPLTARGPPQIMIFDIHALQERFYFSDNVIPRLETAIPLLCEELRTLQKTSSEKITIAFPDDGARKRFGSMFPEYEVIVCSKIRHEGTNPTVAVREGEPKDRHVVIVDDLVQTGGTLIECAQACLQRGAIKVSCFATHAVFPKETWRKFVPEQPLGGSSQVSWCGVPFENFWITDSLPHSREIAQHKPFSLLSLARIIADKLIGYDLLPQV